MLHSSSFSSGVSFLLQTFVRQANSKAPGGCSQNMIIKVERRSFDSIPLLLKQLLTCPMPQYHQSNHAEAAPSPLLISLIIARLVSLGMLSIGQCPLFRRSVCTVTPSASTARIIAEVITGGKARSSSHMMYAVGISLQAHSSGPTKSWPIALGSSSAIAESMTILSEMSL